MSFVLRLIGNIRELVTSYSNGTIINPTLGKITRAEASITKKIVLNEEGMLEVFYYKIYGVKIPRNPDKTIDYTNVSVQSLHTALTAWINENRQ